MKQIIPFKKELLFKTKISEITSISLENTLSLKEKDQIGGTFNISGDYKMTEASINREKFNFDIPFEITLDDYYDASSVKIDIDNFYYEVINDDTLEVNIDVYIDGEKLKGQSIKIEDDNVKDIEILEETLDKNILERADIDNVLNNIEEIQVKTLENKDDDYKDESNVIESDEIENKIVKEVEDPRQISESLPEKNESKEEVSDIKEKIVESEVKQEREELFFDPIKELKLEKSNNTLNQEIEKTNIENTIINTPMDITNIDIENNKDIKYQESPKIKLNEAQNSNNINIFDSDIFNIDTYVTYYVYLVKEDDTIDKILEKFNTTKEELENYNDLTNVKKGTKLIIPSKNNE